MAIARDGISRKAAPRIVAPAQAGAVTGLRSKAEEDMPAAPAYAGATDWYQAGTVLSSKNSTCEIAARSVAG